ncbi:MAG: hypothetical protein K6C94_09730 [Candidatus Gastranaerophilales bacterium]|nr:hypothetical protein [Candidatus Gastranaerophilales bacterium]
MKRRDLLKLGVLAAGAGLASNYAIGDVTNSSDFVINKSDKYVFSVPMPYDYELIDKLSEINSNYKKFTIKSLYNNLPMPLSKFFNEEFQNCKAYSENVRNEKDFIEYVTYAQDKGFHFVYVLNSPKPFSDDTYKKHKKHLKFLFKILKDAGITEIKVANTQLMEIISEETDFDLSASTSFEYHNVSQYKHLLNSYKRIKRINIAIDDNRNFLFLKNLRKSFPHTDIEIMVNETCIHGCPARISHAAAFCKIWDCYGLRNKMGDIEYFFKSNVIYPWQLEAYKNIGINNFKIFGFRHQLSSLKFMQGYIDCVENGTANFTASDFFNKIFPVYIDLKNNPKLKDIISYMPNINHFVKYGDRCANICDIDCTYCLKCAKKLREILL